ncbi:hypothetical protein ABT236_24110 [Streptomyces sp. NPDC001523]|uniref:hypothetical protein n=1 Tax=Streptomyces sp. NPDC001523 TaxID=3154383 RepID=UPI003318E9E8
MDDEPRDQNNNGAPHSGATDQELSWNAAVLATAWVSPATPMSENQGWDLVGLQHMGSAQGEMYAWNRVLRWQRQLVEALTTADAPSGDDGGRGTSSRHRAAEARGAATSAMRDMLLAGITAGEQTNQIWGNGTGRDPRDDLRAFIASHGG